MTLSPESPEVSTSVQSAISGFKCRLTIIPQLLWTRPAVVKAKHMESFYDIRWQIIAIMKRKKREQTIEIYIVYLHKNIGLYFIHFRYFSGRHLIRVGWGKGTSYQARRQPSTYQWNNADNSVADNTWSMAFSMTLWFKKQKQHLGMGFIVKLIIKYQQRFKGLLKTRNRKTRYKQKTKQLLLNC